MTTAQTFRKPGRSGARLRWAGALALSLCGSSGAAWAQAAASNDPDDLVVRGQRGSAITDVKPLARLDSRAIAATGAATMADLLKAIAPMTRSSGGGQPIFLINGQRTGGYEEVGTLPPEAIETTEVLPEAAAIKFGYPPTRTVVNFITKKSFAQTEARIYGGTTTEGGAAAGDTYGAVTRIANGRRLSLNGELRHTDALRQSERHILPDPSSPFDAIGNVTAADGGAIDPALSAQAGHPVTIAAVPVDPAQRGQLASYLPGADQPRLFDIGPYRTLLARTDQVTINGAWATPIAKDVSGTLSLSADRKAERSLQGLPTVSILVPGGSAFAPFNNDVLLNRSLTESQPLVQNTITSKFTLGAALHGKFGGGWNWDLTGSLDENDIVNRGPDLVDAGAIDRAVAGGADPFAPVSADLLANRVRQRSRSINRRGEFKAVASGALLHLPAGDVIVTATITGERATAQSSAHGLVDDALSIGRTQGEAGVSADVPILSGDTRALAFLGPLSLTLAGTVRRVQGYGTLHDTTYGMFWSPASRFQVIGTIEQGEAAANMGLRSAPVVQTANVPFFDAVTGQSVLVTTIAGGNPDLGVERRQSRSIDLAWQPPVKSHIFLRLHYGDEVIRNQALQVTALTPATEAAFPDLFERDAAGVLTTVRFQPIGFSRERQKMLIFSGNFNTMLGKAPPKTADPKTPPPARVTVQFGGAVTPLLQDNLQLRPGSPVLNIVRGESYDATATRRRWGIYSWSGLNYKEMGINLDEQWKSGTHIDGGSPQGDLRFAPLLQLQVTSYASLENWFPHAAWARKAKLFVEVDNPFDAKQRVQDGTGATPDRYQPDYLDPLGRLVKVTLRKLF